MRLLSSGDGQTFKAGTNSALKSVEAVERCGWPEGRRSRQQALTRECWCGGESHRVGGGLRESFVIGRRLSYHSSAVNVPLDIGFCGAGEGLECWLGECKRTERAKSNDYLSNRGEWALEAGMRTAG